MQRSKEHPEALENRIVENYNDGEVNKNCQNYFLCTSAPSNIFINRRPLACRHHKQEVAVHEK